jgi:hypothetical protein
MIALEGNQEATLTEKLKTSLPVVGESAASAEAVWSVSTDRWIIGLNAAPGVKKSWDAVS